MDITHMRWGRCEHCHKDFEYSVSPKGGKPRKYCSKACGSRATADLCIARTKEKHRRELEAELAKKNALDETMKLLHEQGMRDSDYSNYQKSKTLELVGRVLV